MRLYSGKIPAISSDIVRQLSTDGHLETEAPAEVELDIQSVLKEYLRVERDLTERAKDYMESRQLPYEQLGKIKRRLAEQQDFGLGEEAMNWMCTQLVETFMHSNHVDEVYADDATLRREMKTVLRRHMQLDDELDAEVRQRIKNLEEGTSTWELEYGRVLQQVKQKHGIPE